MSTSTILIITLAAGLGTFLIRFSFFHLAGQMDRLPAGQRALRFVPVAVLPALIAPALFYNSDTLDISAGNARLVAGVAAIVVARLTKSVLLTIGVGMGVLLLLQALD